MTERSDPLHAALRSFFAGSPPNHIAAAVSGGSDSVALLSLLRAWRADGGPRVSAVTVDHGLRPDAAAEAEGVARLCAQWDIPHDILHWRRLETTGNLHDQARRARYALMADWAKANAIPVIALGHTQDDQAETFLMRLARASGVDGLSGMRATWDEDGIAFARPLLTCDRVALRAHLQREDVSWIDDEANTDLTFARSRIRAALPALGIAPATLAQVAGHMAEARDALNDVTLDIARKIARTELGDVIIDQAAFAELAPELARRLLAFSMHWITGADYPPRGAALLATYKDVLEGRNTTLQGCDLSCSRGYLRITREAGALRGITASPGALWDGRWRITGPAASNSKVAALGETGLRHCPDRALSGLPARSLIATPAVWQGDKLIAAPLANLQNGWHATLVSRGPNDFAQQIAP